MNNKKSHNQCDFFCQKTFYFYFTKLIQTTPQISPITLANNVSIKSVMSNEKPPFNIENTKNASKEYITPMNRPVKSPFSFVFLMVNNVPEKILNALMIWLIILITISLKYDILIINAKISISPKLMHTPINPPFKLEIIRLLLLFLSIFSIYSPC